MKKTFRSVSAVLIPIVTIALIVLVSAALIAYGRGYRPGNTEDRLIKPTGLITATSDPVAAQVFINNELKTATDATFSIDPGWYTVRIAKEGYQPWQKDIRVQGEVVTRADAFLLPVSPSLSPITAVGIQNPSLSPDGTRIAYVIPPPEDSNGSIRLETAGLWIYELVDRPLGFNRFPGQLDTYSPIFDFENAVFTWSPDSSELLVSAPGGSVRLYKINRPGEFTNVTFTYEETLAEWTEKKHANTLQKLSSFKQPFIDVATSSAEIISFSPDETKVLYEATASASIPLVIDPPLIGSNPTEETRSIKPNNLYVYDGREDKNYFILSYAEIPAYEKSSQQRAQESTSPAVPTLNLQPSLPIHWFPTSRHLVLTLENKIDIMEYDRTNWITVYSGPFVDGFMAPWPNGSRIIIITNLNPGAATLPNLYTINLR